MRLPSALASLGFHLSIAAIAAYGIDAASSASLSQQPIQIAEITVVALPAPPAPTPPKLLKPKQIKTEKAPAPKPVAKKLPEQPAIKQVQARSEPPASQAASLPQPVSRKAAFSSSGSAMGKEDYFAKLRAWLERHKTYPNAARRHGIEGEAMVHFSMTRNGEVMVARIEKSSGHAELDEAARRAVLTASPMPELPESFAQSQLSITVPFGFHLDK